MTTAHVVVVGGGLAGATVIRRLRDLGHEGSVTLVGAERHVPYERPELSKGYLSGRLEIEKLQVLPPSGYTELDVALRLGERATGLDAVRRRLMIGTEDVSYDVLIVATGSSNVRPKLPGMELEGVLQLRTVEDADALRLRAGPGSRVVLVGAGFIGCEVAATLRTVGADVTLVDAQPGPLWGPLGRQLSERVRAWHETSGVRLLMGVGVVELKGEGVVQTVLLTDGTKLLADVVVVGVGVRPEIAWLGEELARAHGGVAVDRDGRTSVEGVYAAGDLAAVDGQRTEHVNAALTQGARVAAAVVGAPPPAAEPEWFWSEQYDHTIHLGGLPAAGDVFVERTGPFAGFFLRDGIVEAVATIDNGRDFRRGLRLLGGRHDPSLLGDPQADLRKLAAGKVEPAGRVE